MICENKWKWFGNVGHFICGRWCRFHLTTQVGEYLVSTVGEYVHPRHSGGSEQTEEKWLKDNWPGEPVGCGENDFYETMVFLAGKPCTQKGCSCGLPSLKSAGELDCRRYATAGEATKGHYDLCREYANE